MANKYMKRYSTSPIIREMQIKATMRYHRIPVRMAKRLAITSVSKDVERKDTLVHSWWDGKLMQPLWKTVWRFLKKLKI